MKAARIAAVTLGGVRIAYDLSLIAAPQRTGTPWVGDLARRKAAHLGLRAIGARDLAINAGIVISALTDRPVRPWLAAATIGDVADVAATFAAADDVPDGVPVKTLAVGGGSAALSALVFALIDS